MASPPEPGTSTELGMASPEPQTTLNYIRSRDRLSKSPAYVLKY
jgi:hypothetical protein